MIALSVNWSAVGFAVLAYAIAAAVGLGVLVWMCRDVDRATARRGVREVEAFLRERTP